MVGVELPPEVIAGFVSEAHSYLPLMVESLAALHDEAKLAEAYRFAHIIKSSAAMLGHIGLSQVAELLEGDLEAFQLGEPATPRHLAQLARSIERIGRLLDAVAGEAVDVDAIIEAEVADRTALLDGPDAFAGDAAGDDAAEADESADADADDDAGAYESMAVDDGTAASRYASADGAVDAADRAGASEIDATFDAAAVEELVALLEQPSTGSGEPIDPAIADAIVDVLVDVPAIELGEPLRHFERSEESGPPANAAPALDQTLSSRKQILRFAQDDNVEAQDDNVEAQDDKGATLGHIEALPPTDDGSVAELVDELAETVLAFGRELASGGADLQIHHQTLAAWLARFERAAGLPAQHVRVAEAPTQELRPAHANDVVGHFQRPAAETPARESDADEALAPAAPAVELAPAPALVELDPASESEAALRRAIEAELRFQIEEEIRARLLHESPAAARPGTTIRLGSAASSAALAPMLVPPAAPPADDALTIEAADVDPETREVFALEAAEHFKRIDAEAAALAADPANAAARAGLRRAVHTLKGAAAMMGFQAVATLAHSLEDRLEDTTGGASTAPAFALGDLLLDLDKLEALVQRCLGNAPAPAPAAATASPAVPPGGAAAGAPVSASSPAMLSATGPVVPPAPEAPAPVTAVPVHLDHLDDLLRVAGATSVSVAAWPALLGTANGALAELRQTVSRVQSLVATLGETGGAHADGAGAGGDGHGMPVLVAESSGEAARFDPLELDRYTTRDYLLHDLAEIAADAHSAEREMRSAVESAAELVTAQRHHAAEIQDRLLAARLVPLEDLGSRLHRAVSGVAARRQKQIEFIFTGGDVAVDRAILDSVADALLHLVRNASDHGIEAPDVRLAGHKPAAGTIHVTAKQEQGEVIIEVADDGQGIDPSRMAGAARAAGLDPATLTLVQAIELIFRPGVSTARKVDDVSGRGVGLDAVREAIERVRGTIEVLTEPGEGTIFSLRFPVTLAQSRVVMTETAGSPLAVPAANVRRVARLRDVETERTGAALIARLEGEAYVIVDLASTLGIAHQGAVSENPPVLFVEAAGKRAALITGEVGSQRDVVVKPLGSHLRTPRGVSGAALLQDGRAALLLHLPDVLAGASTIAAASGVTLPARRAAHTPLALAPAAQAQTSLQVLVVDDSPTIRKLLVRTLKDLGWRTAEAKDGVEALERIRVDRPDVVLSDIEMPHLDGYGLLAALRSKPETAALPVVMLTSRTAEHHRRRASELGASGYLTKPYRPADVVAALRQVGFDQQEAAVA